MTVHFCQDSQNAELKSILFNRERNITIVIKGLPMWHGAMSGLRIPLSWPHWIRIFWSQVAPEMACKTFLNLFLVRELFVYIYMMLSIAFYFKWNSGLSDGPCITEAGDDTKAFAWSEADKCGFSTLEPLGLNLALSLFINSPINA